ncbi:MAG TPA: D-inositol-3-phosphate glycosyltransferase [Frankiaceae bacterium]|nr:D-inositol-3-phosphate glycosyltransferase [Frankiaceae bacterium]
MVNAVRSFPRDLRRVATISVHTSPLDQPGTGDAGGMNVYVVELSRRLAAAGIEVDIFTRTTSSSLDPVVELSPGVTVRHVTAGPFEGLSKNDLPAQLCAFASGVLRAEAVREPGYYDVVHSHYWLSGQVGWLAKERWGVPLVHSFHTLAKVKNAALAAGDEPEPVARLIGETQVVDAADRLIASTDDEAAQLRDLYGADPSRIATVAPGVDLERYTPGSRAAAKALLGLRPDDVLLLFVGRIQPLKAPDVLIRAAAELVARDPSLRDRLVVAVVGGPSGTGTRDPERLDHLTGELGLTGVVRREPPVPADRLVAYYRAAEAVVVPSYNESFGLVALEAQACGTPVVAAAVGGLRTAVRDGESGVLVEGHDPLAWARVLERLVEQPAERARLAAGAAEHAKAFGWAATAAATLGVYRDAIAEVADTRHAVNE